MTNHLWDRFDALVEKHAPSLFASFNPPASETKISAAEARFCLRLPEEIREAYLRHDGSRKQIKFEQGNFFQPYFRWLSLDEVVEFWLQNCELMAHLKGHKDAELSFPPKDDEIWQDMTQPIRPEYLSFSRIPIAKMTNCSPQVLVDLQPGPAGEFEQLVEWDPEIGPNLFAFSNTNRKPITFGRYILALCEGMENGSVTYDEHGWNVKK